MLDKNNMLHYILKRNNLNKITNKARRTDCKTVDDIQKTTSSLIDVLVTNNPKSIKKTFNKFDTIINWMKFQQLLILQNQNTNL